MKKSLLALAVLAAGAAQAQSSVTIYGVADVGYNSDVKKSSTGAKSEASDIITNGMLTSRIGLKGERDLAKGLKGNFVMEFEVDPSSDTGIAKTRVGTVGLSGDFGAVTFGRRNTLIKDYENALDANNGPTAAGYLGDDGRDSRRNDMLTYTSPKFAGFTAEVQLSLGATAKETNAAGVVTNDGKAGDGAAFGLTYANGPLTIKAATETIKNYSKSIAVAGYTVAAPTVTDDRKNSAFGLSYDFGMAKVYFNSTRTKQGTAATEVSYDTNTLGVRVPLGDFTFNAGVGNGDAKLTNSTVKADLSAYQMSLWYALNKETTLYTVYGNEKIKHPTFASDSDRKTFLVGINYKF